MIAKPGALIEIAMVKRTNAVLLAAATGGDQSSWNEIVSRFERLLWSVVRGFRLDHASAADVVQTVWLRLVENIDRIRDPEKLPSWLCTTARHEAIRLNRALSRQVPTEFALDLADLNLSDLDERLLEDENEREVLSAFRQLKPEHQQLLRLLAIDPPLDYPTVAELWGRPQGSIGPTKGRCIEEMLKIMGRHPGLEPKQGEPR
jgi:RNA polymerase sigma factor (sigma-70 family)